MFPTGAFSTATRRKILRVLAEKNKRYTIAELAELCHRSEASISRSLTDAGRYSFIDKDTVRGSKRLTFRLDPESQYTAPIRDFFALESARERQSGTIPVEVWNLLEDVTDRFEDRVDGFVELFLFGSYATGEYYAGSDIDLLLVATSDPNGNIDQVIQQTGDDRLQVVPVRIDESRLHDTDQEEIMDQIRTRAPGGDAAALVPLWGALGP